MGHNTEDHEHGEKENALEEGWHGLILEIFDIRSGLSGETSVNCDPLSKIDNFYNPQTKLIARPSSPERNFHRMEVQGEEVTFGQMSDSAG